MSNICEKNQIQTLIKQWSEKYRFLKKLTLILHIQKIVSFKVFLDQMFFPINFIAVTLQECSFSFAICESLRLLTGCIILVGSAMFDATFNMVIRVGLPEQKDISLKSNFVPLNNCFSDLNVFQNGVNVLSSMV